MKLRFLKDYKYAFRGYDVHCYKANQEIETDSEALISNAIKAGYAVEANPAVAPAKSSESLVRADVKAKKARRTPVKC